jgi:hypothetical protein
MPNIHRLVLADQRQNRAREEVLEKMLIPG